MWTHLKSRHWTDMSRRKQGKPQHLSKREFSRKWGWIAFWLNLADCGSRRAASCFLSVHSNFLGELNRWDSRGSRPGVTLQTANTSRAPGYFRLWRGSCSGGSFETVWQRHSTCVDALCNEAFKVSFAIKGHEAWALWPETFGFIKAAQPDFCCRCARFFWCEAISLLLVVRMYLQMVELVRARGSWCSLVHGAQTSCAWRIRVLVVETLPLF